MWQNVKGMLALPEDPNQRAAAKQGLLGFGAALLGGRGDFGGILADGMMAGSQGYHGALAQQQQSALQKAQQQRLELENRETQAKLDEPMAIAALLGPGAGGGGSSAAPTQMRAPATPGAPAGPVGPAAGFGQPRPPEQQYAQLMDYANRLTQSGRVAQAKVYYDMADRLRPKLKEQRALTVDGRRVMANVYEDGRTEQVEGFAPDAEKLHFANTGGSTVALDPFTGKPINTIANSVSPGERLAAETARLAREAADRRAREAVEAGRNQIVQSDEGPVLVNTRTGTGRAVTAPNGQRLAGVSKPLNDAQSKAYLFGSRMQESHEIMKELATPENGNTTTSNPWSRTPLIGSVVNAFQSENQQMLDQAKRDFMSAVLRRESGAAIADSEYENADKQYFPQVGDSAAVIAQKTRNRELAMEGVLKEVPEKHRPKVLPRNKLPKKPAPGGHPADIGNLLNKYGAK